MGSSDRTFGFVFAAFFAILTVDAWKNGKSWEPKAIVAVSFLAIAFIYPNILKPLNKVWMKFGELLHRIVSPLFLGVLFFVVITPMAIVRRLMGSDVLGLTFNKQLPSYWVNREDISADGMKRQF